MTPTWKIWGDTLANRTVCDIDHEFLEASQIVQDQRRAQAQRDFALIRRDKDPLFDGQIVKFDQQVLAEAAERQENLRKELVAALQREAQFHGGYLPGRKAPTRNEIADARALLPDIETQSAGRSVPVTLVDGVSQGKQISFYVGTDHLSRKVWSDPQPIEDPNWGLRTF